MSVKYLERIHILLRRNKDMISEIESIKRDIDDRMSQKIGNYSGQDVKFFKDEVNKMKIIDKKITDNVVTIKDLGARTRLDQQYFDDAANNFLKRASHKFDNIESEISAGFEVNATVEFANAGTFFSWTEDKNIKLILQFTDMSNIIQHQENFPLVITDEINVPGDELISDDFGRVKVFNITFTAPVTLGEYVLTLMISDNERVFLDTYKKTAKII